MTFFRFCEKCNNRFNPETKFQRLCKECYKEVKNVNFIKMLNFRMENKLRQFRL